MAKEFKTYLAGFATLCKNYSENAKKVAPDADFEKVVNIYQKGLEGSFAGLRELMTKHYDSATASRRRQLDEFVRLSGTLPMLAEANRVIGKNSLGSDALSAVAGIFEELKKIIKFIPGLTQLIVPFLGAVPGLLEIIDQLVNRIFDGKDATVEKPKPPPPIPQIPGDGSQMIACKWYPVYTGEKVQTYQINSYDAGDAVEVRVDNGAPKDLEPGQWMQFTGKKIEVHLKAGRSAPGGVGYKPV